jgi:hypothetical protein
VYCTKCGTRNDDTALTCVQCGSSLRPPAFETTPPAPQIPPPQSYEQPPIAQAYTPPPPMMAGPPIPNYLVQAILTTIFCCLPFGIVSIIYAAQVNSKLAIGDVAGAMAASKSAKTWAWVSFGVGIFWAVCVGLIGGLGMIANIAKYGHPH